MSKNYLKIVFRILTHEKRTIIMPIPSPKNKEPKEDFMARCMSDPKMNEEYSDNSQRYAICIRQSKANIMEAAEAFYEYDNFGYTEDLTVDNFIIPKEEDYIEMETEASAPPIYDEWDVAKEKPGLWENIRRKKEREGKDYKPAKPGDKDRPDPEAWKKAQNAEYQGRKVTLNKPFRTPSGPKKFAVYTKNGSGNVVIVRFGDPNMEIKRDDPARRRSFRARHKCDTPGPKWKARYWSCKKW
jgi:hypothetical protein